MERKRVHTDDDDEALFYNKHTQAVKVFVELNKLRDSNECCDFAIKVNATAFPVHKNVLIANSEYFRAMLKHDTVGNRTECVELKGVDEECVGICVGFMYCDTIRVPNGKREELLCVADMLQLEGLRDALSKYYEDRLNESTFYAMKRLANSRNLTQLETKCNVFAAKNFEAIAQLSEFKNMHKDHLSNLLKHEENTASDMNKVKALLNWIRYDIKTRKPLVIDMLTKINLAKLPVRFRQYLLDEEPLVSNSLECVKLLCSSFMSAVSNNLQISDSPPVRANSLALLDSTTRCFQYFNPESKTWTQGPDFLQNTGVKKFCLAPLAVNGCIYVLMESKVVYSLKYADKGAAWQKLADTRENHGEAPPAFCDSKTVYVAGFWFGRAANARGIEKYDAVLNKWNNVGYRTVCVGCTCVCLNECIYCIGQESFFATARGVEVYDQVSGEWSTAAPLLHGRHYASAATYQGKVYVMGGQLREQNLTSTECYDPKCNVWTLLKPMVGFKICCNNASLIGDAIYCFGGVGKGTAVERYIPKEDRWEVVILAYMEKVLLRCFTALQIDS